METGAVMQRINKSWFIEGISPQLAKHKYTGKYLSIKLLLLI